MDQLGDDPRSGILKFQGVNYFTDFPHSLYCSGSQTPPLTAERPDNEQICKLSLSGTILTLKICFSEMC